MATPEQILALRDLINEPDDSGGWTDDKLGSIIDAEDGSIRASGSSIWQTKAGQAAHLVNISEGGSSRSMGDLYKNALAMATALEDQEIPSSSTRSRTRKIERS